MELYIIKNVTFKLSDNSNYYFYRNEKRKKHWWSVESKQSRRRRGSAFVGSSLFALKTFDTKAFMVTIFFFLFRRLFLAWKEIQNTSWNTDSVCMLLKREKRIRIRKKRNTEKIIFYILQSWQQKKNKKIYIK